MRSGRRVFVIAWVFIAAVIVFSCFTDITEAWVRGGREFEGPRGGEAAEGLRGGEAVESPRGNVAVEGPRGNVAIGTRYNILPDSARSVIVGDRTFFVDDSGIYYLPCDDDDTVYCVVPAP